ncbi:annexin A3a [Callorhinchus milii]|uniref:Annexin n=1 Tax=Callorhinchus milii TaxID=7868 RepID=A0A4W3HIN0_CALMI|nr:annexin A3a [Callorhinchus milii]|eukprot:gi/632958668/ref/XP_007895170.1/ PREDICTED: annexin A3 [Callorhinchus milii]
MSTTWPGTIRGTICDYTCFNPGKDADLLRKALVGLGTDEQAIIDILTHRSNAQRQQIAKEYKSTCGNELIADLQNDLSGDFRQAITALMEYPAVYDAKVLRKAIQGAGTDEGLLTEILVSRNNQQIREIKEAYQAEYKDDLVKDIASDVSGDFKRAVITLLEARRDENCPVVDEKLVRNDAQALHKAGEKQLGTDEDKFIDILCSRSIPHLQATFETYKIISNKDLEESIKSEMSGDLRNFMLTMVQYAKSAPTFFANKIVKSVKGLGTDENTLTRILVTRSEMDLLDIQDQYKLLAGCSMSSTIKSETSGDYKKLLLKICGSEN